VENDLVDYNIAHPPPVEEKKERKLLETLKVFY